MLCRVVCGKSLQSCLIICNPLNYSLPGSSVHDILQARILHIIISLSQSIPGIWYDIVPYGSPGLCNLTNLCHFHGCTHIAYPQGSIVIFTLRSLTPWFQSSGSNHSQSWHHEGTRLPIPRGIFTYLLINLTGKTGYISVCSSSHFIPKQR